MDSPWAGRTLRSPAGRAGRGRAQCAAHAARATGAAAAPGAPDRPGGGQSSAGRDQRGRRPFWILRPAAIGEVIVSRSGQFIRGSRRASDHVLDPVAGPRCLCGQGAQGAAHARAARRQLAAAQQAGYKVVVNGERTTFCPSMQPTGSHMAATCMSESQFEALLGSRYAPPAAHFTNTCAGARHRAPATEWPPCVAGGRRRSLGQQLARAAHLLGHVLELRLAIGDAQHALRVVHVQAGLERTAAAAARRRRRRRPSPGAGYRGGRRTSCTTCGSSWPSC